jgi:hypothetical protein
VCHNCGKGFEGGGINVKLLKPDRSIREMDFCSTPCLEEWNQRGAPR